jgi:hypothetical protein
MTAATTTTTKEIPMYASELSAEHIGRDLTLSVSGILTGGIIDRVSEVFGMVSVTMEGAEFLLDEDHDVALDAELDHRQLFLNEPDLESRHRLMDKAALQPA